MYPLLLDLTGRLCLVVGGGSVGRRKADTLLSAGACVRLVCLEASASSAPGLDWLHESYRSDHLDGVTLAFAAASSAINRLVTANARARGIWVNVADRPEEGDFHVPASVRRGDLLVTVSTGGAAPALARQLRQRLETTFDEAYGQWVALLAELRPLILERVVDAERRRRLFRHLARPRWLRRLRTENVEVVRAAMRAAVAALAGDADPLL